MRKLRSEEGDALCRVSTVLMDFLGVAIARDRSMVVEKWQGLSIFEA
ncbi:hypothetical protein [Baaleninema simplex]|nr:hypothetical protein [Baaleninema simplex]